MTPTPEQIAALAETFRVVVTPRTPAYLSDTVQSLVAAGYFDAAATAILAALTDWTLVPTGEVERLGGIEEAARAVCESPCHTPELEPTVVFDALRAALADGRATGLGPGQDEAAVKVVPTAEVERLRAALEAIGAKIVAASYHRNYRATAIDIHGIANRALAGGAP